MQVTPLETFKLRVEAFLVSSGMAAARFGQEACGDRNFVFDLRKGEREFRSSTLDRVRGFMDGYGKTPTASDQPAASKTAA